MKITVSCFEQNINLIIDVNANNTILNLKEVIAQQQSQPNKNLTAADLTITFFETELKDEDKISDYGICAEDILFLRITNLPAVQEINEKKRCRTCSSRKS